MYTFFEMCLGCLVQFLIHICFSYLDEDDTKDEQINPLQLYSFFLMSKRLQQMYSIVVRQKAMGIKVRVYT